MVINPALLGGQGKDYLEDSLNLASCTCQTNIRAKLPETAYTLHILEARGSDRKNSVAPLPTITAETRQEPRFRGKAMEPRVDFRRVAPSRLLEDTYAYIYPCIWPKRKHFSFLGVVSDFFFYVLV